jgi:hypothetical protein
MLLLAEFLCQTRSYPDAKLQLLWVAFLLLMTMSVDHLRWVSEPLYSDLQVCPLICFNCDSILFGKKCLRHHSKACVADFSQGSPWNCQPAGARTSKPFLRTPLPGQNTLYTKLQWIDCKTCDAQIQWYCNEATIRFREARIAWVRLVVRSINKAVMNGKLRVVVRDTHRFRLDLQLVLNNILHFL